MTQTEKSLKYWTSELYSALEWRIVRKTPQEILVRAINNKIATLEDNLSILTSPTVFTNRF